MKQLNQFSTHAEQGERGRADHQGGFCVSQIQNGKRGKERHQPLWHLSHSPAFGNSRGALPKAHAAI